MKTLVTKLALVSALILPGVALADKVSYDKQLSDAKASLKYADTFVGYNVMLTEGQLEVVDETLDRIREKRKELLNSIEKQEAARKKSVEATLRAAMKGQEEKQILAAVKGAQDVIAADYKAGKEALLKLNKSLDKWKRQNLRAADHYEIPNSGGKIQQRFFTIQELQDEVEGRMLSAQDLKFAGAKDSEKPNMPEIDETLEENSYRYNYKTNRDLVGNVGFQLTTSMDRSSLMASAAINASNSVALLESDKTKAIDEIKAAVEKQTGMALKKATSNKVEAEVETEEKAPARKKTRVSSDDDSAPASIPEDSGSTGTGLD